MMRSIRIPLDIIIQTSVQLRAGVGDAGPQLNGRLRSARAGSRNCTVPAATSKRANTAGALI